MIASATVAALMNIDSVHASGSCRKTTPTASSPTAIASGNLRRQLWRPAILGLFPGSAARPHAEALAIFAGWAAFMVPRAPGDLLCDHGVRVAKNPTVDKEIAAIRSGGRVLRYRNDLRLRPATFHRRAVAQGRSEPAVPANHAGLSRDPSISRGCLTTSRASTTRNTSRFRGARGAPAGPVIRVHLAGDDLIGALEALRRRIAAGPE